MKALYKRAKVDIGLVPQALNNTNSTGKYFPMHMFNKALFWLLGGAMEAENKTSIKILQAKDANGTVVKDIKDANAIIKANTAVTAAKLTLSEVKADDTVTINGVVFTAADAADAANQIFAAGTNNTACAASLAEVINAAGLGIKATSSSGDVTVVAEDDATITITTNAPGRITVATTEAEAFVEVDVGSLDLANGFEYVAAEVTTTAANTVVSVTLIRGDARFEPGQDVAASKSV